MLSLHAAWLHICVQLPEHAQRAPQHAAASSVSTGALAAAAAPLNTSQAATIGGAPATWQGLQAAWARCVLTPRFVTPSGEAHECSSLRTNKRHRIQVAEWFKQTTAGHVDVSHCARFLPRGSAAAAKLSLPIELRRGSTDHNVYIQVRRAVRGRCLCECRLAASCRPSGQSCSRAP